MATLQQVHGVSTRVLPTSILATEAVDSATNFVVGTAPVHRVAAAGSGAATNVRVNVLCQDLADYTTNFLGQSLIDEDFNKWTLNEHAYRSMVIGAGIGGSIYHNVFDPVNKHFIAVPPTNMSLVGDSLTISDPDVTYASVTVQDSAGAVNYALGVDYVLGYDQNNYLIVTRLTSGAILADATLSIGYKRGDVSQVTKEDIEGGYDVETGEYSGLMAIETVFHDYLTVPSVICVPGFDTDPEVAAVMNARCNPNGCFYAIAPINSDTSTVRLKDQVLPGKTAANIESESQIYCWPCAGLDENVIGMSTHCSVQLAEVDISKNFLPYASPSNNLLPMTRLCLRDGTLVKQPKPAADLLSAQAVYTGLNWIGGWHSWGNYTAVYPASSDPAIMYIATKRMISYLRNTIAVMAFQFVDQPMTRRWAQQVELTVQTWFNHLVKVGALLKGEISFRNQDNDIGELEAGHAIFYCSVMPPIPAQWLEFDIELDPTALLSILDTTTA
jgi:Bacteriophage tail sheath protein